MKMKYIISSIVISSFIFSNFLFTVNKNNVEKNLVEIRRQVLIPISHTNISIQQSFASSENVSTADHLLLNVKNYVSPANLIFGQTNQVSGPTPEPTPIYLDEDSSIINYKNGPDVCPLDSINEYAYPQYGPDCSSDGYGKNQDSTFFEGVLQLMDIPVSQFAIDAFMLWKPYENTKACWNPLATTYHVSWFPPGTGCTETLFNSAGVRNYSSKYCGELATARTLLYAGSGNYYEPIRKMLAQESFDWQAIHNALNKWCNECYSDSLTNKWQMLWNEQVICNKPDLTPSQWPGWEYPIVPSSMPETFQVNKLYSRLVTYIDWGITNAGPVNTGGNTYGAFYIDDILIKNYNFDDISAGWTWAFLDWREVIDVPGWHTLKFVADPENFINECDENNNYFEKQFYWNPAYSVYLPNVKK